MGASEIIITADDLGISKGVNDGIIESYEHGILTTCNLLANGLAFDHAIQDSLPRSASLPVGVHLNLMFGRPLRMTDEAIVGPDGLFRGSYGGMLRNLLLRSNRRLRSCVLDEFRAQADRVAEKIGRPIDHFNTQSHIHAMPAIFELVYTVAAEMGCPNVRNVKESPQLPFLNFSVGVGDSARATILYGLSLFVRQKGPGIPQRIMGMNRSGTVFQDAIVRFVSKRPKGLSEICVHPGYPLPHGQALYSQQRVNTWISESGRMLEMEALMQWTKPEFEEEYSVTLRAFSK